MRLIFWNRRSRLPKQPGLYYCYRWFKLLYVGESSNIYLRWNSSRYGAHHKEAQLGRIGCTHITWRVIADVDRRRHEEALVIKNRNPPLNIRQEAINPRLARQDAFVDAVCRSIAWGIVITCLWRYVLPMVLGAIVGSN